MPMASKESEVDVRFSIRLPSLGVTDDGVPVVKTKIFASDFETGVRAAQHFEVVHGEAVERVIGIIRVERRASRRSTSFSGAFESRDPKASEWQPTGPKPQGKPRLN